MQIDSGRTDSDGHRLEKVKARLVANGAPSRQPAGDGLTAGGKQTAGEGQGGSGRHAAGGPDSGRGADREPDSVWSDSGRGAQRQTAGGRQTGRHIGRQTAGGGQADNGQ